MPTKKPACKIRFNPAVALSTTKALWQSFIDKLTEDNQ